MAHHPIGRGDVKMFADLANRRPIAAIANFVANEFENQFLPASELFHFHLSTVRVFIHEGERLSVARPRQPPVSCDMPGEYSKSNIRLFRVKSVCTVISWAAIDSG